MSEEVFHLVEQALEQSGPAAGFELLASRFREEKNYPLLFETRLMRKRHELGLPLIETRSLEELPAEARPAYEQAFVEAAREAGNLYLAEGDIPRAWSYLRAVGEPGAVAEAVERLQPGEGLEPVLDIAFHEQVHPQKGFELILGQFGICRAITMYHQYPGRRGRRESLQLLVRTLHAELVANLRHAIVRREGQAPETTGVAALLAGREWLFDDTGYYVDTSHVVSVLQFSLDLDDPDTLALAIELAEYGEHLSPVFEFRSDPPFEKIYRDYGVYLRALAGGDPDAAVAHFRAKLAEYDPGQVGSSAAQIVVQLLARLGRYQEAIEVSLQHLAGVESSQLGCPTLPQLCQMAGDFERLRRLARERGDLLSFAAAAIAAPAATTDN